MRKGLLFILFVLVSLSLWAQGDAYEDFLSNPLNFGGICRVYDYGSDPVTAAPKGYKPFYVSSYARHGSRYLHREDYYSDPYNALHNASVEGKLTPFGEKLLERVTWIWDNAKGRYGDFSQVAAIEHRGIAQRLYRRYPSVFKGRGVTVRARATGVSRVILSMAASCGMLRELNPRMAITMDASNSFTALKNEFPVLGRDVIYPECEKMIAQKFDMSRFKSLVFNDEAYADSIPRLDYAVWRLYMMYTNTLNLGYLTKEDLTSDLVARGDAVAFGPFAGVDVPSDLQEVFRTVFHDEDLFVLWEATNYLMYASASASPYNIYTSVPSARVLLQDFLEMADAGFAGDGPVGHSVAPVSADLRFGHDMYLFALVTLLGINSPYITDPYAVASVWKDYAIAPMAGNLQMVLYRSKRSEPLVKFLLNEREVFLGSCPKEVIRPSDKKASLPPPNESGVHLTYYSAPPQPVEGPYYRWSEVREWFKVLIEEAEAISVKYANIAEGAYAEESLPSSTKGVMPTRSTSGAEQIENK